MLPRVLGIINMILAALVGSGGLLLSLAAAGFGGGFPTLLATLPAVIVPTFFTAAGGLALLNERRSARGLTVTAASFWFAIPLLFLLANPHSEFWSGTGLAISVVAWIYWAFCIFVAFRICDEEAPEATESRRALENLGGAVGI